MTRREAIATLREITDSWGDKLPGCADKTCTVCARNADERRRVREAIDALAKFLGVPPTR